MKIADDINNYLYGKEFSNGLKINFLFDQEDWEYNSRYEILRKMCLNKNIVHIGCVDHKPETIEQKIKHNKWLHGILDDAAEKCFGIDIDKNGINYLKNVLGYKDVACIDLADCTEHEIFDRYWDYILIPEVLEHQDNPVTFLQGINEKFKDKAEKIIITVPNAFSKSNYSNAFNNFESINTDHRYWFTPYTIAKIIISSGFNLDEIRFSRNGIIKPWTFIKNSFFSRHPFLRNNIIAIAHW